MIMNFEVSERIITTAARDDILKVLETQFRKVSQDVKRYDDSIFAKSIEASFGSINRSDSTTIDLKNVDDGFLAVACVHYRPSVAFWIILIITLFTWVFWLVPIVFYLVQKKTVKNSIQDVFVRVKNEFMNLGETKPKEKEQSLSNLDQLEKLASLKDRGVITDEEFQIKKKELLRSL
jgi:hypothetical protein